MWRDRQADVSLGPCGTEVVAYENQITCHRIQPISGKPRKRIEPLISGGASWKRETFWFSWQVARGIDLEEMRGFVIANEIPVIVINGRDYSQGV